MITGRVPCADHGIATAITTVFNKVSKSIPEDGVKKKVHQYRYADDHRMCSVYALIDACKALVVTAPLLINKKNSLNLSALNTTKNTTTKNLRDVANHFKVLEKTWSMFIIICQI